MAEKKSSYTLADRQAALRDALHRMEPVHQHWRMLESLYRTGAQRELTSEDVNRIIPFAVPGSFLRTVNMILPHLTMVINSVAARDPKMVVTPLGGDVAVVERNATIAKNVLEYFWKRTDATSVLRDMTQDMVITGNGFAKTGWAYSESTTDRTAEDVDVEISDLLEAAQEVANELGQPLDDATVDEIVNTVQLAQHLVELDEPYVEYVAPYDILVPANARRLNNARWVAQRLRLPIDELKSNPLFTDSAKEKIKADRAFADPTTLERYDRDGTLPEIFSHATVYEFYDMKDRTLSIFQLDSDEPLFEGPIPYAHRYPPFVHMRNFNDGGSSFWAFGDVENVAGIQLMVNEIMLAELNDLKRVGNKYFIQKKYLTADVKKALQDNQPDQVIPIDVPATQNLNEVLVPVQRLATPQDNFVMESKLQDYMQRILGISELQAGSLTAASRVPATAAAAVEGASTTRAMDKMVAVEKAAREVGVRMLALCQQFLDSGKAIRIAGPDSPTWLEVTAQDIDGEFSIETEGGSTQAINPATRARQGVEMLQQVVPVLAQLGFDPTNTVRTALGYMGLNPDHLLVKPEAAPTETPGMEQMPEGMTMPDAAMSGAAGSQDVLGQLASLGGSPVPAATEGDIVL